MTEFYSDVLRHKFAYVALGKFKPGRFADAQKLYEKAVSTYKAGFQGAYLLQKPGTDEGIAIIIWNSIEDMEENKTSVHEKLMEEMSTLFAESPETDFFEVCSEIKP